MCERDLEYQDMLEYHAVLAAWAVFNVNRAKHVPFIQPTELMARHRSRTRLNAPQSRTTAPQSHGQQAVVVAPVPASGMRYAKPGERPPSKYAPGENDQVIEKYDAWVKQRKAGRL